MADSVFLAIDPSRWVASNQWAFAIRDQFPVSPGHTLIIPRRVVADWWSATTQEQNALMQLVDEVKAQLDAEYEPAGYNLGFNAGEAAGQTVFHLHVHLIPRYRGDMPDPRGGVRHVIPSKGNYLAPDAATPDEPASITPTNQTAATSSTPIERLVDDVIERADLTAWLLTIITAGRKTATYKPALLMALLDTAIDSHCDPHSELVVPVDDLAHRVSRYYWPQTNISPLTNGILKQATGSSRITDALVQLRVSAEAAPWTDLDEVALTHPEAYARALDTVADTLIRQPIPRLQRPGSRLSRDGYSPRLYDDSGFTSERLSRTSSRHLTLRPGVAHTLAVNALSLRPAVESIWCREVVRYNRLNSQEEQLREFLFGTQRRSLVPVREALLNAEGPNCYWCERSLRSANVHVDHVIPWRYYPLNVLENLVLADSQCNADKSARLVDAELLTKWRYRDPTVVEAVADSIDWPTDPLQAWRVGASAYRWLPTGMPVWAGRGVLQPFDDPQRQRILAVLS